MADLQKALDDYKTFLKNAQAQHEKTIQEATAQLEALIENTRRAGEKEDGPQSVWITGNDGEPLLLLNEAAAKTIENLLAGLQEVLAELIKKKA